MKHKVRHELFMLKYEPDEKQIYDDLCHLARVTLTEHYLVSAIRAVSKDPLHMEAAKTLINNQIKSWGTVGIRCTDVQDKVWALAQQITSGKQPQD